MNFNITIGQYLKGDSWLYKLDPRFKILSVVILMIVIFMLPSITYILILLGLFLLIMLTAKLPLLYIIKGLKPVLFLSIFSFVLQLIYTNDGNLLYTFNLSFSVYNILICIGILFLYIITKKFIPFKITYLLSVLCGIFCVLSFVHFDNSFANIDFNIYSNGLKNGMFFVSRIFCIVILSTLLTLTTSTLDLNTGLERVLYPFKFIGLPISEISLMISLTLRFVPTLLLETNKILKAQASRGVDFTEGSIIQKVKQIITLLIPMFVVSFKRADDLACAMETRGYVIGEERTSLNKLKYSYRDYIGYILVFSALAYVIVLQVVL